MKKGQPGIRPSVSTGGNVTQRQPGDKSGFVIYAAMLAVLTAGAVGGFFLYAAYNHSQSARRWHEADQCLLDAQSALERVKHGIVQAYLSNQVASPGGLDWFQSWSSSSIGSNPVYSIPPLGPINGSAVTVVIARVAVDVGAMYADVNLVGAAVRPTAPTRAIGETLRVTAAGGGEAMPFDYALLLDNSAILRNNMVINGDIRVNGDLRLSQASYVNGARYSSGKITANSPLRALVDYWKPANTGPAARPADPPAAGGMAWPMGYVPDGSKNMALPRYPRPVIGDIDALASSAAGRISRNGVNIAVNSYAGPGPDNLPGTADDNCLVLDGSSSPIVIEGAVVVKGDVIIRGRVTGQGTIYAGRNVHIVGDLSYVRPPSWPKPDVNPVQTASANAAKDLLVLAARGSVVVGNYTSPAWSNRVWGIMTDPARITPADVTATDAAIGYDSDNDPSNGFRFDGRYFANEANNGRRLSGSGTNTVPRKYYESSLGNAAFSALCDANNVPSINAALFANHGILGDLGSSAAGGNTLVNGAMVCRDDLNNFYGSFTLNWDIRLGSRSRERVNTFFFSSGSTGATAAASTTVGWREIK